MNIRNFAIAFFLSLIGCEAPAGLNDSTDPDGFGGQNSSKASSTGAGLGGEAPNKTVLDDRTLDYNEALRTASLKLMRALPDLATIRRVQNATDQKSEYEAEVDKMLEDPRFRARMVKFWRDTMRQGGSELMDHSPVLAARISVDGSPFVDVFTATTGTCPTFENGEFVDDECENGVPVHAGVLTNPGSMKQFYSNMAFRRVRWIQEVFACQKFPAEVTEKPTIIDGKDYVSPWPFESVSNSPINFQDTQSVVCANCHTTMNHIAPLFANFDSDGVWMGESSVSTPVLPQPITTEVNHWLATGEKTAWRFGVEADDLPALGAAMADDPIVADCITTRLWNMVMSKEDVVNDLATVPSEVLDPLVEKFESTGMNVKETLRFMLKHDDFVNF
jgi:hypothetical protein